MKIKTIYRVIVSYIRNGVLKIKNGKNFSYTGIYAWPITTKIIVDKNGKLTIGKRMGVRSNLVINVRENAELFIGNRVLFNDRCSITCRNNISISDDVIFGPGCMIFDHDHDYHEIGLKRKSEFITDNIKIGKGVWFGANCIILKGTVIGDNCVFGAGTIVHGHYDENLLVVQERKEKIKKIVIR